MQGKDGCAVCNKSNWRHLGLTQRASWKPTHPQATLCLREQPGLVRTVHRLLPWMVCSNRYELGDCPSFSGISSLITQSPGCGLGVIGVSADQGVTCERRLQKMQVSCQEGLHCSFSLEVFHANESGGSWLVLERRHLFDFTASHYLEAQIAFLCFSFFLFSSSSTSFSFFFFPHRLLSILGAVLHAPTLVKLIWDGSVSSLIGWQYGIHCRSQQTFPCDRWAVVISFLVCFV